MTTPAPALHCGTTACSHTTHKHKPVNLREDRMEKAFRIAEKVCAIALGVLAAVTSYWLFLPAFAVGTLVGIATYKKPDHHHGHHHHDHKHSHKAEGGSCSHGFIEQTTGVEVPRSIALMAGFAVMAVHIDHHAPVFVPIVGVTLGLWAGKLAAPTVNLCFKKIQEFVTKPFTVDLSHIQLGTL